MCWRLLVSCSAAMQQGHLPAVCIPGTLHRVLQRHGDADHPLLDADEVDAIGAKRYESQSGGEREIQRTMLELLNQMDGFDARGDVKVDIRGLLLCLILLVISLGRLTIHLMPTHSNPFVELFSPVHTLTVGHYLGRIDALSG